MSNEYHKAEVQRRKELEQRSARMWLLDDKLYDLYNNDPLIHASLQAYIHGHETLEKCLIIVVEALINNRKDLLHELAMRPANPIIKIGEVK
jgi:hypothetical protein